MTFEFCMAFIGLTYDIGVAAVSVATTIRVTMTIALF
jgi:hypothetical protein